MTTPKPVTKVYTAARAARDATGTAWLAPRDVSTLLRYRLAAAFPGVKFSVRLGGYSSVTAYWTDGPTQSAVDSVVEPFAFGGFDGMIDLAYAVTNWLTPDGRIIFAATRGTEGSCGSVSAEFTDCPEPGAILVRSSVRYAFTSRHESPELWAAWIAWAAARYGCANPAAPWHAQRSDSAREFLTTLVRRHWADLWREDRIAFPRNPEEVTR